MAEKTGIAWADSTFNPWIGCSKISPACDNCYAEREWQDRRHVVNWGPGAPRKRTSTKNWNLPYKWNAARYTECGGCGWRGEQAEAGRIVNSSSSTEYWCPSCGVHTVKPARRRVFCASLGDVFDNEVSDEWRSYLFERIRRTPNLDWLLLTKRIGNVERMMLRAGDYFEMPRNVWLGISVCNQAEADRDIPKLLAVPAAVRFLSIEPMLGPIDLSRIPLSGSGLDEADPIITANALMRKEGSPRLPHIDWVICGGESGKNARPMHPVWVRSLRDQCGEAGTPFLFKQWGEWVPRSDCYHTFADGQSCADLDPGAAKWPCIRLTERGLNGRDLANAVGAGEEAYMQRVGVKMAGRLLDSREHNEFPSKACQL